MSNYSSEIIEAEILKLNKRNIKLDKLIESNPAIEFIELQQELKQKLESGVDRMSAEFQSWLSQGALKEQSLKRKMKTQTKDQQKWWDEKLDISEKIVQLNNDLYYLKRRA